MKLLTNRQTKRQTDRTSSFSFISNESGRHEWRGNKKLVHPGGIFFKKGAISKHITVMKKNELFKIEKIAGSNNLRNP